MNRCQAVDPRTGAACVLVDGHGGPHAGLYKQGLSTQACAWYAGTAVWFGLMAGWDDEPPWEGEPEYALRGCRWAAGMVHRGIRKPWEGLYPPLPEYELRSIE